VRVKLRYSIFRRRHGALIDALRRSNELLAGADTPRATTFTPYHAEEVAYIRKVNARLLRHYDPSGATDRRAR
jgi:hypothetical protein